MRVCPSARVCICVFVGDGGQGGGVGCRGEQNLTVGIQLSIHIALSPDPEGGPRAIIIITTTKTTTTLNSQPSFLS